MQIRSVQPGKQQNIISKTKDATGQDVGTPRFSFVSSEVETKEILASKQRKAAVEIKRIAARNRRNLPLVRPWNNTTHLQDKRWYRSGRGYSTIFFFYPSFKQKKSELQNNGKRPVESNAPPRRTKQSSTQCVLETTQIISKVKDGTGQGVGTPRFSFVQSEVKTKQILPWHGNW